MASLEPGEQDQQTALPGRARRRALVVSEDIQLVNLVAGYFRSEALEALGVRSPSEAPVGFAGTFELAVFDVSPRNDRAALAGLAEALGLPIIAVSAATSSEAIADLLRAGADTVIIKPFTLDAFDAHVEALQRRAIGPTWALGPLRRYTFLDLVVDFQAHTVTLAGQKIRLSAIQYRIVDYLCRHAGAVVTPSQLSDAVWGPAYDASSALIRSHIRNIRKLLRDPASNPRFIRTENQMGYWMPRGDSEPT